MGKKKNDDAGLIESIVDDARETFDLGDFLRGRSVRTKTVRVFTDEVTAERRGGFERIERTMPNGAVVPDVRSWGLVKDLAEAQVAYDAHESKATKAARADKAKVESLTEEIRALTATMLETSLEIELKSVPEIIRKDAWRAARKALGIHGKDQTPEQAIAFLDEQNAQILTRVVVSITKHGTEEKNSGISIESARNLVGYLSSSEWAKLEQAINELLFEKVIADQAVSDPDF